MIIDGRDYLLLKDYDKGKYHHLTFNGKKTYLEERIKMILIHPCAVAMTTASQVDLGLILATAICAGISAGGTFLKGRRPPRGQDKVFFIDFVNRYMDPVLRNSISTGTTWAEWLYDDVRCGLAHNFTIENGGIEYEVPSYVMLKSYGPEVSPSGLLEDFARGWSRYLADVMKDGAKKGLGALFEQRFDQIFHD